ncbi:hypothetical protein [Eggerthella sinensis]|jgi:hypothetical protein|uniref:hypothetical protein n=1 Tax=Eggerthella sinensis TaxID=242230 RepID=UPI00248ED9BE|nr:hypothetical protein [Eggerthella sinensis]
MRKHSEPRSESNSTPDPKLLVRIASGEVDVHELGGSPRDRKKTGGARGWLERHLCR